MHPDENWNGTALPPEASTDMAAHHFLTDPAVTGRIDAPYFRWSSRCCIHGLIQTWEFRWPTDLPEGLPPIGDPTHGGGWWMYVGITSCPQSAGDHGPHGNHITTETPVSLLDDDPLTSSFLDTPEGRNSHRIPLGDHHHVYTAENDPFGLYWNHNHGRDPAIWDTSHSYMKAGSGGWPQGQAAPNQTYTHTHIIASVQSQHAIALQAHRTGSREYSPEDGAAGGMSSSGIVASGIPPSYGYDHQHDGHGLHFHYHMYTHTHYAAPVDQPILVEPWKPYFNTRPAWWQDGMEDYFENPLDLGLGDLGIGEDLIFGSFPRVDDPSTILAEINAISAGFNPELIFLGGDVFGVQGYATVSATGQISGITITDPGATVVNVTEGTADDVGGDGIVSPDILLTKPEATDAQIAEWAAVPLDPLPFSWFENFSATAHISDNPTVIAEHLPDFFKSEGELRAEAASSGYVDPIAQTFMVNIEDAPNGLFIASIDLCFQNKPAYGNDGDPITVELRETVNGYPSSENILSGYGGALASRTLNAAEVNVADAYPTTAVRAWEDPSLFHYNRYNGLLPGFSGSPYAIASLDAAGAITSIPILGGIRIEFPPGLASQNDAFIADPSLIPPRYTRFIFPSPIFLSRNTEYAIVVRSNSAEYMCWVSDARSVAGTMSTAVGAIGGSVPENFGFVGTPNLASHEGPQFGGSFFKSQNGRTWSANQNKDLMFRLNRAEFTASEGTVSMSGGHWLGSNFEYDRAELDAFSLMTPEATSITQTYQTKPLDDSANFTTATDVSDILLTTKSFNERMVLGSMKNSSGTGGDFKITSTLNTTDSRVSPVIDKTNINVKTIKNRINDGGLSNNQINIVTVGIGFNSGGSVGEHPGNDELDIIGGGGTGAKVKVTTGVAGHVTSAYISDSGTGYYKAAQANNISDSGGSGLVLNLLGEEGVSGGNGKARYITKSVTLAPNMDAIDLKVYITASKPAGSSIRAYYRVLSQYDQQSLDEKKWTAMELISPDEETTSTEVGQGIEPSPLEFEFGTVDDYITYSVGDQTFNDFKIYAIKIVSFASNFARVPVLTDFRAIAVT
ncbi:MAG TPA: hypothetical protein EYN69_11485 [Flavobacteriales bacterium]|nr:hypothetical protein [Flavobacteriales bacterium]